ncbi:hypothetical protein [Haloechinothrix salitolerans]|uniref:Uncharacterized protein n=1 Tax=Haloechinothrix salitolerans TaxID=926830 RepID=A0ABW2BW91_9PSEU
MTEERTHEPELLLTPPPGFVGLPLRANEQDNAPSVDVLAAKLTPHAGEHTAELPRYVTWFAHLLAEESIRLYGRFPVDVDAVAEPVLADLAVAITSLNMTSEDQLAALRSHRDVAAARLRQRYQERHPHADVRVIRLAIGPAMVAVTAGEYRLPSDLTGNGHAAVLPRITAEFQIPTPDGAHVVLMTVSTANDAACQAVLTAAMRVANSVRVTRPRRDTAAATPSA